MGIEKELLVPSCKLPDQGDKGVLSLMVQSVTRVLRKGFLLIFGLHHVNARLLNRFQSQHGITEAVPICTRTVGTESI